MGGDIHIKNLTTNSEIVISPPAGQLSTGYGFSNPDLAGNLVVFMGNISRRIDAADARTGERRVLALNTGGGDFGLPRTDGRFVVFADASSGKFEITVIDTQSGERRTITAFHNVDIEPDVDGGIVVWRHCLTMPDCQIWSYDWNTGQLGPVTTGPAEEQRPHIDAGRITFLRGPDLHQTLVVRDLASGVETTVPGTTNVGDSSISGPLVSFTDSLSGYARTKILDLRDGLIYTVPPVGATSQYRSTISGRTLAYMQNTDNYQVLVLPLGDLRADAPPPTFDRPGLDSAWAVGSAPFAMPTRGVGAPGARVDVYADGAIVATTTAGADGAWSATPPLGAGSHTLLVRQTTARGTSWPSEEHHARVIEGFFFYADQTTTSPSPLATSSASSSAAADGTLHATSVSKTVPLPLSFQFVADNSLRSEGNAIAYVSAQLPALPGSSWRVTHIAEFGQASASQSGAAANSATAWLLASWGGGGTLTTTSYAVATPTSSQLSQHIEQMITTPGPYSVSGEALAQTMVRSVGDARASLDGTIVAMGIESVP